MSQPPQVLLAYPTTAHAAAHEIGGVLSALGYRLDLHGITPNASARGIHLDAAPRVLILWSRDAAKAPALRALAKRARSHGKLTLIRLDAHVPPAKLGAGERAPRGRTAGVTWRRLLEQPTMTLDDVQPRTSRLSALLALLLMSAVAAIAGYHANAPFAAQIDGVVQQVQDRATSLLGG